MTRNITITDEAYERLRLSKTENESFTDVVLRITRKRKISDLAGLLTPGEADRLEESIRTNRASSEKRLEEIRKKLRP